MFDKSAYWKKRAGDKLISMSKQLAFDFDEIQQRLRWTNFDVEKIVIKINEIKKLIEELAELIESAKIKKEIKTKNENSKRK